MAGAYDERARGRFASRKLAGSPREMPVREAKSQALNPREVRPSPASGGAGPASGATLMRGTACRNTARQLETVRTRAARVFSVTRAAPADAARARHKTVATATPPQPGAAARPRRRRERVTVGASLRRPSLVARAACGPEKSRPFLRICTGRHALLPKEKPGTRREGG